MNPQHHKRTFSQAVCAFHDSVVLPNIFFCLFQKISVSFSTKTNFIPFVSTYSYERSSRRKPLSDRSKRSHNRRSPTSQRRTNRYRHREDRSHSNSRRRHRHKEREDRITPPKVKEFLFVFRMKKHIFFCSFRKFDFFFMTRFMNPKTNCNLGD